MAFNSLQNIYSNVRAVFQGVGLQEWEDAFNIENIPSAKLDRAFHMNVTNTLPVSNDFTSIDLDTSLEVNWFLKGYRYPSEAKIEMLGLTEEILVKLLNVQNRTDNGLANILLNSSVPQELGATNDNIVLVRMVFTIKTTLYLQQEC